MLTLKIEQDTDPLNPRRDYDNAGQMVCWHRSYSLGDESPDFTGEPEEFVAWAKQTGAVYLPLYLYGHGNLTISAAPFSCRWDSGQVGYVYMTREAIAREFPDWKLLTKARREKIEALLRAEVETYDQYLTGEVYGYVIEDEAGETVESCWGFYGDCQEEGEAALASLQRVAAQKTRDQGRYLAACC